MKQDILKFILRFRVSLLHSVVKGKLYLFGGSCHPQATECLMGMYCFDIGEQLCLITLVLERNTTAL